MTSARPFLAVFVALAAVAPLPSAQPNPPADTAILAVEMPPKATLTVDGKEYTGKPELTFGGCQPGRLYHKQLVVTRADGKTVQKEVCYRGGWRVQVRIPDADAGRPELVAQSGHSDAILGAAFTPDGNYLVTAGSGDRTAVLWETATGRQVRTYAGNPNMAINVAVSPDGTRLAVAVGRHESFIEAVGGAVVYDLATGTELARFDLNGPGQSVAFVPGNRLIVGGWDGKVSLLDIGRTKPRKTLAGHAGPVWGAAVSADGSSAVTGSDDGSVIVWDLQTEREVKRFRHPAPVRSVGFAKGGKVLTGCFDGTATLWDRTTGNQVRTFRGSHAGPVLGVAVSPNGDRILTGGADKTAVVWDADTGKPLQTLRRHKGPVTAVDFDASGKSAVTASYDQNAYLWRTTDWAVRQEFRGRLDRPWMYAFSPDGNRLFGGSGEGVVNRWSPTTDPPVRQLGGQKGLVRIVHFSPKGDRLVTGSDDRTAVVRDATTGAPIATLPASADPARGHAEMVITVKLSPDGRTVFTGTRAERKDGKFGRPGCGYLWDATTGKLIRRFTDVRGSLWDAEFTRDGRHILIGDGDETDGGQVIPGRVVEWEVATGNKGRTLVEMTKPVTALAAHPDGRRVLVCGKDRSVSLYDLRSGSRVKAYAGFDQFVSAAVFSPDGDYILSTSSGLVRLKETESGRTVRGLSGHTGPVDVLAPHPDGRHVLTAGGDGVLRYWDLATGDELAWLVTLDGGRDWLVATRDGYFDGTSGGRDHVRYRTDGRLQVVDADRFFKDFYRPGLLRDVWTGTPPEPTIQFAAKPAPRVRFVTSPPAGPVESEKFSVVVEVLDRGGGIGKVSVRLNGNDYLLEPTRKEPAPAGRGERRTYELGLAPGQNDVAVQASAATPGTPESEPARLVVEYAAVQRPASRLYLFAVGVGKYSDAGVPTLNFPVADVTAISALLKERAKARNLHGDVQETVLTDQKATAPNIRKSLDELRTKVRPSDTLVVFLSGHGAQDVKAETGGFLLVTHDAKQNALRDTGLTGAELMTKVQQIPAGRKLVVLDTCHAGAVVADSFRGDSEELARNTGVILLTAVGDKESAIEAKRLGHGLLTYCLLRGANAVKEVTFGTTPLVLPAMTDNPIRALSWADDASDKVDTMSDFYKIKLQPYLFKSQRNFPLLGQPASGGK